jgi:glutamine amidotransferase
VIALIDYKAGNLTSVRKAFAALGAELYDPTSARDLERASAIVVPGVGHFGATSALAGEWMSAIRAHVAQGRPLLGICLGLQWLFAGSDESPECAGLGLLEGRCYRLGTGVGAHGPVAGDGTPAGNTTNRPEPDAIKVPHVGWNSLALTRRSPIVEGVASGAQVYFTHSFVAPVTEDTVAVTEHGEPFAAIVERGLVAGVQFHPEKSGDVGLQILRNFLGSMKAAS